MTFDGASAVVRASESAPLRRIAGVTAFGG
jgi:hypothetical protein